MNARLNRAALVWGVLFVAIGGAFLLDEAGVWEVRISYLVPLLLILAGVVLLVGALFPAGPDGEEDA
jgi:hypothetical protein